MNLQEEARELLNAPGTFIRKGYGLAAETVKRRHLVPKSILVGVIAGLTGIGLRTGTEIVLEHRLHYFRSLGQAGWFCAAGVGAVFGFLAVWVIRRFCKEAAGGGMSHLQDAIDHDLPVPWWRLIWVKTVSLFAVSIAGMGGGPEAPAIHIGGAIGKGTAETLRVKQGEGEHRALMSAGAAAGLSAAFNAPLTGLVFALEELQGNFDSKLLVSALLASVSADIVGRQLVGGFPVFTRLHELPAPDMHALPFAILLGLVAGILGVFINRQVVRAARAGASATSDRMRMALGALVGAVGGALSVGAIPGMSGIAGGGVEMIRFSFTEHPSLHLLGLLFIARLVSTIFFTQTGAAGGFLIPILALGAICGRALGDLVAPTFPEWVPHPGVIAVLGMGAFFSASIRAPLTGLVLMLELTGNYGYMLPSLVACLTAHIVADESGDPPVYHALRHKH